MTFSDFKCFELKITHVEAGVRVLISVCVNQCVCCVTLILITEQMNLILPGWS